FKRKALAWLVSAILVGYGIMLLFGNGFEFADNNVIVIVDKAVLGEAHMYTDHVNGISMKFDPEGLLSTLPSIAHMLIGFLCGGMIMATKDNSLRINRLFIVGAILTFAGFLLDYGMPINKKIWSPTFVLTTCGLASSFLALLIWIIDIKGYRRWSRFFESFGVNPLFLYVLSTILAVTIGVVKFPSASTESGYITIKTLVYNGLNSLCGGNQTLASLCFAILFVLFNWCIGVILYKKKIYIKI
ncbi:MAG: DUF5009 domain-containing protein, partial [Muribaculaceae bacterium]|nr:DUF5009 domain-containing protein [Muribaculaceae bacterium]